MARKNDGRTPPKEVERVEAALKHVEEVQNLDRENIDPDSVLGVRVANEDLALATVASDNPEADNYQEPWTRLPDETDRQWEMFLFYRNLGPTRSFRLVQDQFEVSQPTVSKMAAKKDWRSRVTAFDNHEDWLYQAQRVHAIREMADVHSGIVVDAIKGLNKPLEILVEKLNDPNFVAELQEEDAASLLSLARQSAKILPTLMSAERLARGMATEIVEHQGEVTLTHDHDRDGLATILDTLAASGVDFSDLARVGRLPAGADSEIIEGEIVELREGRDDADPEANGVPST